MMKITDQGPGLQSGPSLCMGYGMYVLGMVWFGMVRNEGGFRSSLGKPHFSNALCNCPWTLLPCGRRALRKQDSTK